MPDLVAQGPLPQNRWRRRLMSGARQTIGRAAGAWSTGWDERISRRHVEVVWDGQRLHVQTLEGARNPVFYRGHKSDSFALRPGDHFVIGQTTFSLVEERAEVARNLPQPAGERTFTLAELRAAPFRRADQQIEVLSRLPEMISGSASDQELCVRLVNLLLSGIERATAAAVIEVGSASINPAAEPASGDSPAAGPIAVLHWDRRVLSGADFRPSERLIRQSLEGGASTAFTWSASQPGDSSNFTVSEGIDWAFCVPVAGNSGERWALYVTGTFAGEFPTQHAGEADSLRDDVKFTELVATTLSALRQSHLLARRQAGLRQFFSPVVLEALGQHEPDEVLAPREADVTVMFCDLRGFTQQSERSAGDLFELLSRVSRALGAMTHQILQQGGVVGDFHGDAAMGFWGWPLAQPDSVERACRAALGIRTAFSTSLRDSFRVGIGIASGRAVAGKIGTTDQVKVTVFGPVVNLAARLETMTKQLRAAILIDPPTAAVLRSCMPTSAARVRRLAKVRPVGLTAPLEVSELLPPAAESTLSDEHLAAYESALDAFHTGNWPEALRLLHQVPPEDQAKDFLTVFIAQHNRVPPAGWDGAIPLEAK
jgi:adenylate cyclase